MPLFKLQYTFIFIATLSLVYIKSTQEPNAEDLKGPSLPSLGHQNLFCGTIVSPLSGGLLFKPCSNYLMTRKGIFE